jgi:nucleoside diphosphate kinase
MVSPLVAVLDGHAAIERALRELIATVNPDQAEQDVGTVRLHG